MIAGISTAVPHSSQASTAEVRVYFAVCDGSGASDTVKIKRINEDGSNAATIGDTTIAYCADSAPTTYFSGLAVHDGFAYFSWMKADGSAAGVGRMSTTESGSVNLNYATAPAGVGWLQVAPRVLNNYLYFYAHDGGQSPTNLRVMRVPLTGGTIATCFAPSGTQSSGDPTSMAIGVGNDAVYYAFDTFTTTFSQRLYKVASDCSSSTVHIDLADGNGDSISRSFVTEFSPSMFAESSARMYFATRYAGGNNNYGISHIDAGKTATSFVTNGTANSPDGTAIPVLVWGVNRLYFKNGTATKMYAVTPGSEPVEVFASHIKGKLHHISVVTETPVVPTTTTVAATTTTTVPAPTTTVAPVVTRRTVKLKSGATVKPLIKSAPRRSLTAKTLLQLPKGATATRITSTTPSVCSVKGTTLRTLKKGRCRYSVVISHKKKSTTVNATMAVS